jgi:hypothetical protein
MVKKWVVLGMLLILCVFSVSAQFGFSYDLLGTVVGWVTEYFEDDSEFDGCTFSPDGMFLNGRYIDWRSACNQHDRDYENGLDKDVADRRLRDNMIRAGAPRAVAEAYYQGVQMFGQSFYDAAQEN